MRFKFTYLLAMIAVAILIQGCSLKARIKKADKRYSYGEYYAAGDMYKKIIGSIPSADKALRARIYFHQAECYRLTNYNRAEQAYNSTIRYKYSDSIVYLRYAQVLQRNGKFGDAINNYSIYLQKDSSSILAKNGIAACTNVASWFEKRSRYAVKKEALFNYRSTDNFSPAYINPETDALIFTSSRQFNKKIILKNNSITGRPNNNMYLVRKNAAGNWEKPNIMGEEINTVDDDEGVCCVSFDGKTIFYTHSKQVADSESGTEIFTANRAGGTWSTPQKLVIFRDSTISVAHPALDKDGRTLYFVSDAKGGFGGKDIWKGTFENGECKYIENLGPEINTPGDEMFPTMRADGTLYYSSNGKPGFGGLDIFRATPGKAGKWTVENMGAPINSSADDFGMTFEGKLEKGFFSSNRNESKGYDAIWSFELPDLEYIVEGIVTDEKGNIIPDATVKLVSDKGINTRMLTKKDGTYRIKMDKDQECVMMASSRGYLNQKNTVSTIGLTDSKSFVVDFKLAAIYKSIQIDNIFYEFGKWDLTPTSEAGLQILVKMLNDNPNITIEISANTDYIGGNSENKILSAKRAKSVVDYLISRKIAPDRLTSVGYGEEKPVTVDANITKTYPFLKENDILDEAFVLKLTPEQQNVVNQINRRTEFRVVKTTYNLY